MNIKIKKHVDSMFSQVPYSKKAEELKEEIMSDMEAAFNDNVAAGDSENEAFRKACDSLGNMEEVIENLIPEKDIMEKIDRYKRFRAAMTTSAVIIYILAVAVIVGFTTLATLIGYDPAISTMLGTVIFLVMCAIATGLIVFSRMSIPQEVVPYIKKTREEPDNYDTTTKKGRFMKAFAGSYWTIVTVIYFIVSFSTGNWGITWLIFLIGGALEKAVRAFGDE